MQNRGMARRDQAESLLAMGSTADFVTKLTKSNNVGKGTESAEVEVRANQVGAAAEQADGNGDGVGGGQADDTNTREGVEGGARSEIDDTEDNLDSH